MGAITELTVKANISELRKELGKIPGITAAEAKAMTGQLVRESKKAGRAAEKAGNKSKKAWGGSTKAISKTAKGMSKFKGVVASASGPLAGAAAAAATFAAAIGVAVGATAAAAAGVYNLAKANSDLIDKLQNGAALAGLSVTDYTALGAALDATGSSSDKLAPAMGKMIDAMQKAREGSVEGVRAFGNLGVEVLDSAGNLRNAGDVARDVAAGLAGLSNDTDRSAAAQAVFGKRNAEVGLKLAGSIPLLEEFGAVAEKMITPEAQAASAAFDESMARLALQSDATKIAIGTELTPVVVFFLEKLAEGAPLLRKTFAGANVYFEGFANGARVAWGSLRDGWEIIAATRQTIIDGLELPLRGVYEAFQAVADLAGVEVPEIEFLEIDKSLEGGARLLEKIEELQGGAGHLSQVFKSGWLSFELPDLDGFNSDLILTGNRLGAVDKAAKEAADSIKDNTDALVKQWLAAKAYGDEIRQMVIDDAQADLDAHAAFVDNVLSDTAGAAGEISSIAGEFSQRLAEEGTETAKEQARAAFAIAKAAALSEIIISTAVAAMNIQEKYAAAPPVAAALTAVLMGTSAANMALVASEQPSFHRGGMISPDEVSITAQKGEAVLSRSGVQAAGGAPGVNALNSGAAGGGGVMIINQVYRHRVFDRVVSDSIKRTNSPLNKALNAGRRVGMSK